MPEIGSLRALANGESQFVGSSSGVYFINTVRRAFSSASDAAPENKQRDTGGTTELRDGPSPEDCIIGGDEPAGLKPNAAGAADDHDLNPPPSEYVSPFTTGSDFFNDMRKLPEYTIARKLVLTYFRIWHPLVPFLQGSDCLAELDALYSSDELDRRTVASPSQLVTFRCIFNIALLESDEKPDIGSAAIQSSSDLLPTLSLLALRSDACSIQALLSAQVYFVSVMSLRHASSVGGLISKSIYQSGMHRCPVRYGHLSPDERSMRKRIFWSFYVLDRFVSQSLGHPNGIQDSDIDVCPPGHRDLHKTVAQSSLLPSSAAVDNTIMHLPANHPGRAAASPKQQGNDRESSTEAEDEESNAPNAVDEPNRPAAILRHRRETQAVLENHVRHSQLVGRILDVFHKSIHARDMNSQTILFLKADITCWGNDLSQPRLSPRHLEIPELAPDPTVFPFIAYHYTVLLLNRPSLSLDSRCAEFRAALQTCIGASNTIIPTVGQYSENGGPLFWPGYMSAVWMSGLVLALAARMKSYNVSRAKSGIRAALKLLTEMEKRWRIARDCKHVLFMLLQNIDGGKRGHKRVREDGPQASTPRSSREEGHFQDPATGHTTDGPPISKRRVNNPSRTGYRLPLEVEHGRSSQPRALPPSRTRTPLPNFIQQDVPTNFNLNSGASHKGTSGFNRPIRGYGGFSPNVNYQDLNLLVPSNDPQTTDTNMGNYFAPSPTIFLDRHRNAASQQTVQFGGNDNFFDIFDGATWGSLIDIVNDAGTSG